MEFERSAAAPSRRAVVFFTLGRTAGGRGRSVLTMLERLLCATQVLEWKVWNMKIFGQI